MKILDVANIPDKKSFPPRMLIIFMGTVLALAATVVWIFGNTSWQQVDAADPRKAFAQEVFTTVSARLTRFSRNGNVAHPTEAVRVGDTDANGPMT